MKNQPLPERGIAPIVEVAPLEPDSSIWGTNFPNQYASLQRTYDNNTRTTYGGSEDYSKLEADPRLLTLFAGYPFSLEYNEERGHLRSLEDVQSIARVNETTHATCYSCKSSNNPSLWDEMGMAALMRPPDQSLPMITLEQGFLPDSPATQPFPLYIRQFGRLRPESS